MTEKSRERSKNLPKKRGTPDLTHVLMEEAISAPPRVEKKEVPPAAEISLESSASSGNAETLAAEVPVEIKEIYGNKAVPIHVLDMYKKLPPGIKSSYLDGVRKQVEDSESKKNNVKKRRSAQHGRSRVPEGQRNIPKALRDLYGGKPVPADYVAMYLDEKKDENKKRILAFVRSKIEEEKRRAIPVVTEVHQPPVDQSEVYVPRQQQAFESDLPPAISKSAQEHERDEQAVVDANIEKNHIEEAAARAAKVQADKVETAGKFVREENAPVPTVEDLPAVFRNNRAPKDSSAKPIETNADQAGKLVHEDNSDPQKAYELDRFYNATAIEKVFTSSNRAPRYPVASPDEPRGENALEGEYIPAVTEKPIYADKRETAPIDATRGEGMKNLKELISKLVGGAKEKFEWWKSGEDHLIRRSKELDAEAEKIGGIENFFRKVGEKYNKMDWKYKLVLGAGLGLGAGLSAAAVSLPGIIGFTTGIVAQRTAALMTMYLKFEKANPPYGGEREKKFWQWGSKEKAFSKAFAYSMLGSLGIGYAVKEIAQTDWAQDANKWLSHMMGHSNNVAATGSRIMPAPEYPFAPPPLDASLAAPAESLKAMPDVNIPTSTGRGYEWMAKRVWESLPKTLNPADYPVDSDIRQLLEADSTTIDKVVHKIASDPRHTFFSSSGSVKIDLASHMKFNGSGMLTLDDLVKAPDDAPLTPLSGDIPTPKVAVETGPELLNPDTPEATPHEVPVPNDTSARALDDKEIGATTANETHEVGSAADRVKEGLTLNTPEPDAAESVASPEAPPAPAAPVAAEHTVDFKVNTHGLPVDVAHAEAYLSPKGGLIVFGGTTEERIQKAFELVSKDHSLVVYFDQPKPSGPFGLMQTHHLTKVFWFEGSGGTVDPTGVSLPVEVKQPMLTDDTTDPTLKGGLAPGINDLKEIYKPKVR